MAEIGIAMRLSAHTATLVDRIRRHGEWFFHQVTPVKLFNMAADAGHFATHSRNISGWPVMLKIDISPLCNLHCPYCVHARPNGDEALLRQNFTARQRMTIEQYQNIIDQVRGRSFAISLFYLGDPLMHAKLTEFCRITHDAGLVSHVSTNLSYNLSDDRIRQLVESGLTHLTVCVDGLSQETYGRTRRGGKIDWVLHNLERVCRIKRELGRDYPNIEVQYLKYQHNLHELDRAQEEFAKHGVNRVSSWWGSLHNYTDFNLEQYAVHGPRQRGWIPKCAWPYFTMLVKYNGDVIPCCHYRQGTMYTPPNDGPVLGNVFETSVREVWNAEPYRDIRRLLSNPRLVDSDERYRESFCYGCSRAFETDAYKNRRVANAHTFEELYEIDEEDNLIRKDSPIPLAAASVGQTENPVSPEPKH
jgi:MoaA/NifB/PqqE/SkfB family radical SAM enzyme